MNTSMPLWNCWKSAVIEQTSLRHRQGSRRESAMKIHRATLKILLTEIEALDKARAELNEAAEAWIKVQDRRDIGWNTDADSAWYYRSKLERTLVNYRQHLATIYDFMGDKGF